MTVWTFEDRELDTDGDGLRRAGWTGVGTPRTTSWTASVSSAPRSRAYRVVFPSAASVRAEGLW